MDTTPRSFEVHGFTIEVHNGGRRVWPPSLKRFVDRQIEAGALTVGNVMQTCKVSQSLVYKWRSEAKAAPATTQCEDTERLFSQIVVSQEETIEERSLVESERIHLTTRAGTVDFPAEYPVEDLVKVILAVNAQP